MHPLLIETAEYNQQVNPGLPLINIGTSTEPVYFVAELCTLLPSSLKAKLSPKEQDAMIQFACRPPPANALSITQKGRELLRLDSNPLLVRPFACVRYERWAVLTHRRRNSALRSEKN